VRDQITESGEDRHLKKELVSLRGGKNVGGDLVVAKNNSTPPPNDRVKGGPGNCAQRKMGKSRKG